MNFNFHQQGVRTGMRPASFAAQGFTLIELMIALAILAILTAIAYPMYSDHIIRGRLIAGMNGLSSGRVQMEQLYQDTRAYSTANCATAMTAINYTSGSSSSGSGTNNGDWAYTCATTATGYTITATGANTVAGFVYTINETGWQATTALPSRWSSGVTLPVQGCWIGKKGQTTC